MKFKMGQSYQWGSEQFAVGSGGIMIALALANHGRWKCGTAGTCARLGIGESRWGWRLRRRPGRVRECEGA